MFSRAAILLNCTLLVSLFCTSHEARAAWGASLPVWGSGEFITFNPDGTMSFGSMNAPESPASIRALRFYGEPDYKTAVLFEATATHDGRFNTTTLRPIHNQAVNHSCVDLVRDAERLPIQVMTDSRYFRLEEAPLYEEEYLSLDPSQVTLIEAISESMPFERAQAEKAHLLKLSAMYESHLYPTNEEGDPFFIALAKLRARGISDPFEMRKNLPKWGGNVRFREGVVRLVSGQIWNGREWINKRLSWQNTAWFRDRGVAEVDRTQYPSIFEFGRLLKLGQNTHPRVIATGLLMALIESRARGVRPENVLIFGHALDHEHAAALRRTFKMRHHVPPAQTEPHELLVNTLRELLELFKPSEMFSAFRRAYGFAEVSEADWLLGVLDLKDITRRHLEAPGQVPPFVLSHTSFTLHRKAGAWAAARLHSRQPNAAQDIYGHFYENLISRFPEKPMHRDTRPPDLFSPWIFPRRFDFSSIGKLDYPGYGLLVSGLHREWTLADPERLLVLALQLESFELKEDETHQAPDRPRAEVFGYDRRQGGVLFVVPKDFALPAAWQSQYGMAALPGLDSEFQAIRVTGKSLDAIRQIRPDLARRADEHILKVSPQDVDRQLEEAIYFH